MRSIKESISKKERILKFEPQPIKRFHYSWTFLADEMSNYFKTNCYWLFWKFPERKIREKFFEFKKLEKPPKQAFAYYMGMLREKST